MAVPDERLRTGVHSLFTHSMEQSCELRGPARAPFAALRAGHDTRTRVYVACRRSTWRLSAMATSGAAASARSAHVAPMTQRVAEEQQAAAANNLEGKESLAFKPVAGTRASLARRAARLPSATRACTPARRPRALRASPAALDRQPALYGQSTLQRLGESGPRRTAEVDAALPRAPWARSSRSARQRCALVPPGAGPASPARRQHGGRGQAATARRHSPRPPRPLPLVRQSARPPARL